MLTEDVEIQEVVEFAVAETGFNRRIDWSWNNRLTSTLGRAWSRQMRIELSSQIWKLTDVDMRRETIIHEVCHVAADHLLGPFDNSHGWEWVSMMEKCGYYNPSTKHSVDIRAIQAKSRYPVFCDCQVHLVTTRMLNNIQKYKAKYSCRKCGSNIREES